MLVLWSGGLDSTVVLIDLLSRKEPTEKVKTLSINHNQIPAGEEQKEARQILKEFIHNSFGYDFEHYEFDIPDVGLNIQTGEYALPQPPFWIANATFFLEPTENLYLGWIQGDCVWKDFHKVETIFNNIQIMLNKTGKLVTPFEYEPKRNIIKYAKEFNILDKCWWCENPHNKSTCGKCNSCIVFRSSEWMLNELHSDEFVGELISDEEAEEIMKNTVENLPEEKIVHAIVDYPVKEKDAIGR